MNNMVKGKAQEILSSMGNIIFPIKVNDVLNTIKEKYGYDIQLYEYDFSESKWFVSWMTKKEWDQYHIILNPNQWIGRYRFTAVHELWHIVLWHFESQDTLVNVFRKESGYSENERLLENQANEFSAELLMPEDEVFKQSILKDKIEDMAQYFWVSEKAMHVRLSNLELLSNYDR